MRVILPAAVLTFSTQAKVSTDSTSSRIITKERIIMKNTAALAYNPEKADLEQLRRERVRKRREKQASQILNSISDNNKKRSFYIPDFPVTA